jgi:hypothetical protein
LKIRFHKEAKCDRLLQGLALHIQRAPDRSLLPVQ